MDFSSDSALLLRLDNRHHLDEIFFDEIKDCLPPRQCSAEWSMGLSPELRIWSWALSMASSRR